jgi:hypothetical protein
MDATYNFSLGFAQGRESKTETSNPLFNRQTLQMISTGVSLVSLSLGFSIFGMLIIVNQHQADLNDLSGNSSFPTVGGIAAILVGTAFLVAACLHWRCCALPVPKSARAVAYPHSNGGRPPGCPPGTGRLGDPVRITVVREQDGVERHENCMGSFIRKQNGKS